MKTIISLPINICFILLFLTPVSLLAQEQSILSIPPIPVQTQNQNLSRIENTEEYPHKGLMQAAWDAYNAKDYNTALKYAERCIAIYDTNAKKLQASLRNPIPQEKINLYWQLSDVATAKFMKGKILTIKNRIREAKTIFSDIAQNYGYAMTYDPGGWYWNVANASLDALKAIDLGIDFGNSSSSFLTVNAWHAYNKKDYKAAIGYAEQCIKMYKEMALWQQKSLTRYPEKAKISKYWALNDVGTCYYIAGKSYRKLGQKEKARSYFSFVKHNLYFSSCWDPKGWYWKVADALKQ